MSFWSTFYRVDPPAEEEVRSVRQLVQEEMAKARIAARRVEAERVERIKRTRSTARSGQRALDE